MTDDQAQTMIDKLTNIENNQQLTIDYLNAINTIMVNMQPYIIFLILILTMAIGIYIGQKWGQK